MVGGGGGYEIANKIDVYRLADPAREPRLLKELVHSEETGRGVANYLELGAGGLNVLAACVTEKIVIYKIDVADG